METLSARYVSIPGHATLAHTYWTLGDTGSHKDQYTARLNRIKYLKNIRKNEKEASNDRQRERRRRYRFTEAGKRSRKRIRLKKDFGLSLEGFDALLQAQNGLCAICRQANQRAGFSLSVDHCHVTGRIRGLLCNNCNRGIGMLGDSPERLQAAIEYLRK